MRFGSVCSGIEAASVAWGPLGWQAAWFSEIEPFPSAVLAHHYPDTQNLGNMTALPERIAAGEIEAPDVLCGGTPCQAFSVAGLRKSLDDARGNLSLTFCEIANAIDSVRSARGEPATIVFWENVPGVLSTGDNAFGCFLAGLAGEDVPLEPAGGRWTNAGCVYGPQRAIAWRVLDAQYFGLAQRRKRVFVVASARDGFDPAAILFESEGVRRDTAPSREERQAVALAIAGCSNGGGANGLGRDVDSVESLITQPTWWDGGQLAATITTKSDDQRMPDKANAQLVLQPIAFHPTQDPITSSGVCHAISGDNGKGCATAAVLTTHTLRGEGFDASEDGTGRGTPIIPVLAFDTTQITSAQNRSNPRPGDAIGAAMQVRRLTPVECERLQGFPDGHTDILWRGKPAPDGPRYKALGNSWAVPVVRWIGKRINETPPIDGK